MLFAMLSVSQHSFKLKLIHSYSNDSQGWPVLFTYVMKNVPLIFNN